MHCFGASSLLALMATASLIASTSALPTRRSTSSVGRRARLARRTASRATAPVHARASNISSLEINATHATTGEAHRVFIDASAIDSSGGGGITGSTINVSFNDKRSHVADDSILVDASASSASAGAGINDSTINLTVISRFVRSRIFGRRAQTSVRSPRDSLNFHPLAKRDLANKRAALVASRVLVEGDISPSSGISSSVEPIDLLPASSGSASPVIPLARTTPNATLVAPTFPPLASATSLPPITLTITLVPSGPGGSYVDAALLDSSSSNSSSPESSGILPLASSAILAHQPPSCSSFLYPSAVPTASTYSVPPSASGSGSVRAPRASAYLPSASILTPGMAKRFARHVKRGVSIH